MLVKFWVSGYKCFRDKVELDFTDKKNYCYGKNCLRGDFLDKIVIMGNNGSGKTNFGYAVSDIICTLAGFTKDVGQNEVSSFLNECNEEKRARFHYEFTFHGSVVVYEYTKILPDKLMSELLVKDKTQLIAYDLVEGQNLDIDFKNLGMSVNPNLCPNGDESIIKIIFSKYELDSHSVVLPLIEFVRNSVYYRAMWKIDEHIGIMDYDDDVESYIIKNNLVDDLQNFLRNQGHVNIELDVKGGHLMIRDGHSLLNFLKVASRGTAILCRLYCWNRRSGHEEALMYFDDFDDMFHYDTAESVMSYIIDSSKAQCIFVTHNTGLISSDFLRPDCCFIMNNQKLRSLASLTDKSLRRGHNLGKMLRDGEFNDTP